MSTKKIISALARLQAGREAPETKDWLAVRKSIGADIDPDRVEVRFEYAQVLDPYNICTDFPEELDQIGREYFARSSEDAPWVSFDDLPKRTVNRLWQRMRAGDFDRPNSAAEWAGSKIPKPMLAIANSHGLSPNKMLWQPTLGVFGAETVAGRVLVRSTTRFRGPLIIKDADPGGALFVLTIQDGGRRVRFGGWMDVHVAKQVPVLSAHGAAAHFIKQSQLCKMDDLQRFLACGD